MKHTPGLVHIVLALLLIVTSGFSMRRLVPTPVGDERLMPSSSLSRGSPAAKPSSSLLICAWLT